MAAGFIFLCFTLSMFMLHCGHCQAIPRNGTGGNLTSVQMQTLALLSFKSMVSDPAGLLFSWNSSSHPCKWRGVGCGRRRHRDRVVALSLNSLGLSGSMSPSLGNLSYLRVLDLGGNSLTGHIPLDLGHLRRLRLLNLTANSLQGDIPVTLGRCTSLMKLLLASNHLRGEIPGEIGALGNLVILSIDGNNLSGNIPPSLGNLTSLVILSLANNSLSGTIPASFGDLSSLQQLLLWLNHLSGHIPPSLGRLSNLFTLDLETNNLTGPIPPAIWNLSSLVIFAVNVNQLSGRVHQDAFNKLPHLQVFSLMENLFHGHLPSSLVNATNLVEFEAAYNFFTGTVPPNIGRLQSLQWLVLAFNSLEAKSPADWGFMRALTNCSQLQNLELRYNKLSGTLPSAVSNLSSTTLTFLSLGNNEISGQIPEEIGNLVSLQDLELHNNSLTGNIPSSLSMIRDLTVLRLDNNSLGGPVPTTIGNLTQLNNLALAMNDLSGIIPSTVGSLVSLLQLDLSSNYFTGAIPSSLFNITTLAISLDISNNLLEGPIPPGIGNLQNLAEFHAMSNQLKGKIPITLAKCKLLQILQLQNNSFTGNIPSPLSELKGLEILDLSSNNFSGQIPKFLGDFTTLYHLNLSFNNFDGQVPTAGVFANATEISVLGNTKLCGGIQDLHLPPCFLHIPNIRHKLPMHAIVILLVATITCIVSLHLLFFFACHKKRARETLPSAVMRGCHVVSYQQLAHATDGFSTANLLGEGSYGSVYRGNLCDPTGGEDNVVAVKLLKLQTPGALKSFAAECEAMRNLRHRNLVKIITACSSIDFSGNDFKAIVSDFMPNGSLEEWLHPNMNNQPEERHLSLVQRVSILCDVAHALDYLHFNAAAPVVHCDLKPSNVLLDDDMVAHVGDFGLARILAEGCSSFQPSTSSMGFRGTIGYAPPEYGAGNMVSTHGDIYSYGVLILEMVTGKRPTDDMFGHGLSLRKYVEMSLINNRMMDIIDAQLANEIGNGSASTGDPKGGRAETLISLLKFGILCSKEMPANRISTKDIIRELHAIKN
ncbi:receptor kinase-like protein Xa21 [Lolium perenne]|uniref:receptor kinase-like protein Xa21 n=1 Tax=Lolium perenne TaxID=4522 RepID=UPI0021F59264|nr:receptor kinase-like protein Xa21 [Lolium perenne]